MNPPEDGLERIELLLRPDADPIAGWIQIDGEAEQPFTGWMGLMSLLQRVGGPRQRRTADRDRTPPMSPGAGSRQT